MQVLLGKHWHHLPLDQVVQLLETDPERGLDLFEIRRRQEIRSREPREPGIMQRQPRDPQAPVLTGELVWRIVLVGTLILIGAFGLFEWELIGGANTAQARSMAVSVVVVVEMFYLFNCRSLSHSMLRIGLLSNPWVVVGLGVMIVLQALFIYTPFANRFFSSAPIGPASWGRILLYGLFTYLIVESEKWLRWRKRGK